MLDGCIYVIEYQCLKKGRSLKMVIRNYFRRFALCQVNLLKDLLFRYSSLCICFIGSELSVTGDVIVQGTKNSQDRWLFDDGTPMTYFKWNSPDGQPNNGPTERYIHIKTSIQCFWHDFGIAERPFLCQIHENN